MQSQRSLLTASCLWLFLAVLASAGGHATLDPLGRAKTKDTQAAGQTAERPQVAALPAVPPRAVAGDRQPDAEGQPRPAIIDPRPLAGLGASDLQVLYTATVNGYLEPCGCVAGRMGGIDRIAAYVQDQQRQHPAVLYLEGGDLFHDALDAKGPLFKQLPAKAETFFAALGALDCAALALGEFDLVLGVEVLLRLSTLHGVPILCGNLTAADGSQPFPSSVIVERGGIKIGIFALLADQIQHTGTESERLVRVDARERFQQLGLKTEPFTSAAERILAELRPQVDRVILLSHLGYARNRRVAEMFPDIDLIVGGHVEAAESETTWIGNVPIACVYNRGARVGRIDFWWQRGQGQRPAGPAADISNRLRIATEAGVVSRDLELLSGRAGALGQAEFDRRERANLQLLERLPEAIVAQGPLPKGALFAHVLVPMFEGLGRSEAVLEDLDRYHAALAELWPTPEVRANEHYLEAERCADCHPAQYDFWKGMRHSRAWHTLEVTGQQYDAECIGCHSVGFGDPKGYLRPNQSEGFQNVQCASCHGPANTHLASPAGYLDGGFLEPSESCAECHNKHHDPRFDLKKKLPLVTCPPIEPPGQGSAALLASLASGAEAAAAAGDWRTATLAQRRRADFAATLSAARAWRENEPKSVRARQLEAEALLELGQIEPARELLEKLLVHTENDPLVWSLYARALLPSDPAAAMPAAREAYSLAPDYPENAVLIARVCLALDLRLEALDVLRAHLERLPQQAPIIQPVIDEMGGLNRPTPQPK